ncbi:ComEA family DNA-binding protein [Niveibacterium sp.]|uniref:ComEA family DNA-binding protein n=1 Tax=Niveibacterium sp. TaxID=2017444 RepID=UPI0035ADEB79
MSMAKETRKSFVAQSILAFAGACLLMGNGFAATASTSGGALPAGHPTQAQTNKQAKAKPAPLVDINSASKAQLKTLYGVGDAEADRIIAARPFKTKTDLVTTAGLPAGIYVANKHKIIAIQKTKPSSKG